MSTNKFSPGERVLMTTAAANILVGCGILENNRARDRPQGTLVTHSGNFITVALDTGRREAYHAAHWRKQRYGANIS